MGAADEHLTVYVELIDEGVSVWRPVPALRLKKGVQLLAPNEDDYSDETWRFKPGEVVEVESRQVGDEVVIVAVSAVG